MAIRTTQVGKGQTVYFAMPITSITFNTPAEIAIEADDLPQAETGRTGDSVFIRRAKVLTSPTVKP